MLATHITAVLESYPILWRVWTEVSSTPPMVAVPKGAPGPVPSRHGSELCPQSGEILQAVKPQATSLNIPNAPKIPSRLRRSSRYSIPT